MTLRAPAKVNLTLEVFGLRADGYHALRSVVAPISLMDEVTLEPFETLTGGSGLPNDLCLRAARALDVMRGAKITVKKNIPVGGGLGGGSADAAATLKGLNELWKLGLTPEALRLKASQVGSDVPSLLAGRWVLMEGRGERVAPWEPMPTLHLVLANPGVASSTAEVYRKCRGALRETNAVTERLREALENGSVRAIDAALINDLEVPALRLYPAIGRALTALREEGAIGAHMSGSGSTVFGLVATADEAQRMAARLKARGLQAWAVETLAHFTSHETGENT